MSSFLIIVLCALIVAFIAAWILRKKGYTFLRSFITWFLAAAGIMALIFKLLKSYLGITVH